jgi:hypothetical protein
MDPMKRRSRGPSCYFAGVGVIRKGFRADTKSFEDLRLKFNDPRFS